LLTAMVHAAQREVACQICPQGDEQPVERSEGEVQLKPVYR
jgi:hypothetical protein